jgi:hypothetical protein
MQELFPLDEAEKSEIPIVDWIAARVGELLDRDPELLFSYLYRLDVPESEVNAVIEKGGENIAFHLAEAILQRQQQRQETKSKVDVPKDIDTMGLDW